MAKKLVRYKNVNGTLVKQFESPVLVDGLVDISQLPVVGTMSSAIIERGSNANGEYVKWADGMMICWSVVTYLFNSVDTYQSVSVTFPVAFITAPVGGAYHRSMPGQPMQLVNWPPTNTFVDLGFHAYQGKPNGTTTATIHWFAIGRWK